MRVKIFCQSASIAELESRVNEWLAAKPAITVRHVTQSGSGDTASPLTLTISYDD